MTELALAQSVPSVKNVDSLIILGHSVKTKNVDSVLILANTAFKESNALHYELGLAKSRTLAAFYYLERSQYDTARFLLNESLQHFTHFKQHKKYADYGHIFLHLSYLAVKEDELGLACSHANTALEIFKQNNHQDFIPATLILLGGIESNQGNYAKGLAYFSNALRLKLAYGYPEERCITDYTNIAAIYTKIGLNKKAIQYSKKALALAYKTKQVSKQVINLNNLGTLYSSQNSYDSALYYFEQCLDVATISNRKENRDIALYNIASLYQKNGDYKKSASLIKKVIESKATINVQRNAEILLARNYLYSSQNDSALVLASMLYRKFVNQETGNKESLIALSDILAEGYKKAKSFDSALHYLQIKNTLQDSLSSLNDQRKLSQLYAEVETLEKEAEIEILQQNNLLQMEKSNGIKVTLVSSFLILFLFLISVVLMFRNKEKSIKIKNNELNSQLEKKKWDLQQQTLKIIYMNNRLMEIESSLKKLQMQTEKTETKDLASILETIYNQKTIEKEWENFITYFDTVYGSFNEKMAIRFPNLSVSEKRLISLIKMDLKNREIASILNIDSASVKMAKYRLKKKLHLPEEIDIQVYLQNFN